MVAVFCLRLAAGLIVSLLLLSPAQVNPRFFRTHFLTALGLVAVAAVFVWQDADIWLRVLFGVAVVMTFAGSAVWLLEGAPGGRGLVLVSGATLLGLLIIPRAEAWMIADDLTSAAVLGTATTAMLIGHSYLIAPAMSLTPLKTMLAALSISVLVRMGIAGFGLWLWTTSAATDNLETVLWLTARWGLGFVGPLVLAALAWQTTKIRSTQSATGILYVVVILAFLGELTSLLLVEKTKLIL